MAGYLITGGAGSMGQQLTKYLLRTDQVERLVIYSRDEYKHAAMEREFNDKRLRFFIGDVRDSDRLKLALNGIDYVIHAAALKRVEKGEYEPREFKRTNIDGTEAVIDACIDSEVKRAVYLATDKGVEAINVYGKSKSFAESEFISACHYKPIFNAVRYGNIINSRGSVIPYFRSLVRGGAKTLPVTWPNMTRFAMTYQMAINLVMLALSEDVGVQQVFVAKARSFSLIRLCEAFDCERDIVGTRPGEKLHEVLINEYESMRTQDFGDHFRIRPELPWDDEYQYEQGEYLAPWTQYDSYDNSDWMSVDEIKEMLRTL